MYGWIYNEGKELGLEHFGSVNFTCGSYEWNTISVLVDKTGETPKFYWAHESGCSCDGPLEDIGNLNDFHGSGNFWELSDYIRDEVEEHGYWDDERPREDVEAEAVGLLSGAYQLHRSMGQQS